jgi:hypothetical protein
MLEKCDKYSFKVSKSKPFDFKRFLHDWKTDGGWYRIFEIGDIVLLFVDNGVAEFENAKNIPVIRSYDPLIVSLWKYFPIVKISFSCVIMKNVSTAMRYIKYIERTRKEMEEKIKKEKQTTINVYGDFDKPEPITPKFKVGDNILRNVNGGLIPYTITCIAIDNSVNIAAYGLGFINMLGNPNVIYHDIKDIDSSSALIVDYTKIETTKEQEAEAESEPTE